MTQKQFYDVNLPALIKHKNRLYVTDCKWAHGFECRDSRHGWYTSIHYQESELIQDNYDQEREEMNEIEELL